LIPSVTNRTFSEERNKRKADREEHNAARKKRRLEQGFQVVPVDKKKEKKLEVPAEKKHSPLVFGLNAVTKGLEKNELSLVIVCTNVSPPSIIYHLPYLCHSTQTPLCTLQDKSEVLGQLFGLKKLLAVGFRVCIFGFFELKIVEG
jgi:ribosomal protein L7Ae-like RNA K-turn-binding protein